MLVRKKYVAIVCVGVAAALVAGCSSSKKTTTPSSSAAGGASSGAATGGSSSSGGGSDKTPIKVGAVLPLSGPLASASVDYQLVIKNLGTKIPNSQTIDGRPVQMVLRDDAGTATGEASAVRPTSPA